MFNRSAHVTESAVSNTLNAMHMAETHVTLFMKTDIAFRLNSLESMKTPIKMRASSGRNCRFE